MRDARLQNRPVENGNTITNSLRFRASESSNTSAGASQSNEHTGGSRQQATAGRARTPQAKKAKRTPRRNIPLKTLALASAITALLRLGLRSTLQPQHAQPVGHLHHPLHFARNEPALHAAAEPTTHARQAAQCWERGLLCY